MDGPTQWLSDEEVDDILRALEAHLASSKVSRKETEDYMGTDW